MANNCWTEFWKDGSTQTIKLQKSALGSHESISEHEVAHTEGKTSQHQAK